MKQMIFTLQKDIPMIRANLFGAIQRNLPDWEIKTMNYIIKTHKKMNYIIFL